MPYLSRGQCLFWVCGQSSNNEIKSNPLYEKHIREIVELHELSGN